MNPLGLTVLGFPCNQFGKQEPGQRHEILPGLKWEIFVFHCTSSLPHRKHCLKNTHEWIRVDEGHGFPENSIGFWCDNIKFPSIESHAYRKAVCMCCKVRSFKAACRLECAITVNPLSINKTSLKHESIFWQFLFESLCSTPRTYVSDCISHHRSIVYCLCNTLCDFTRLVGNLGQLPSSKVLRGMSTDRMSFFWIPDTLGLAMDSFQTSCCLRKVMWMGKMSKRFILSLR